MRALPSALVFLFAAMNAAPAFASNAGVMPASSGSNTVVQSGPTGPARHDPSGGQHQPDGRHRGHHRDGHGHHHNPYGVLSPNSVYHGPHP